MNLKKTFRWVRGGIPMLARRMGDQKYPSFEPVGFEGSEERFFTCPAIDHLIPFADQIIFLSDQYLKHNFDLLRSGWVNVRYGMSYKGMGSYVYAKAHEKGNCENLWRRVNSSNQKKAEQIRAQLPGDYVPIDWQVDFKSGYRWGERVWHRDIFYGEFPGADIKVPWELGRMQHLAQLVWAYVFSKKKNSGFRPPQVYVEEFQNQILDFISANPPRWGVNWSCPMDVAIRAANWLAAYDLFRSAGAEFGADFIKYFWDSIYLHGRHIIQNLEWNKYLRSNHYLSNIVGLLFIGAYLRETQETNGWLALAVREFVNEVNLQFNSDGGNFEASSCYHRFSSEMVAYGTALISALPQHRMEAIANFNGSVDNKHFRRIGEPLKLYTENESGLKTPFSSEYWERLERMAELTLCMIKPDGCAVQMGDNDDGRWFKFFPSLRQEKDAKEQAAAWFEDSLDFRHLVGCLNGFFDREDFRRIAGPYQAEGNLIKALIRRPAGLNFGRVKTATHQPLDEAVDFREFPDFGIFIYSNKDYYCAVRCGSSGQKSVGGHSHNDQLSFELTVRGQSLIADSGTFVYSALPEERNLFRSTAMHNTLVKQGVEQNDWDRGIAGLFRLKCRSRFEIPEKTSRKFCGIFENKNYRHERHVEFFAREIRFRDTWDGDGNFEIVLNCHPDIQIFLRDNEKNIIFKGNACEARLCFTDGEALVTPNVYSRGYGHRVRSQKARIKNIRSPMSWSLQWA